MRYFAATICILLFCLVTAAQENNQDCPAISVTGPSSIAAVGEPSSFSAKISREAEKYNVEYFWEIDSGKIISGQGTKNISVKREIGENVTAQLTVKGLPEKCPNTVSETISVSDEIGFYPIKVDEFDKFGGGGTRGRKREGRRTHEILESDRSSDRFKKDGSGEDDGYPRR